jgi:hypothetical protein
MQTECIEKTFVFQPLGRRAVVGRFDGGTITSDAGALLLREVDRTTSIIEKFAACFTDLRDQDLIEPELKELIAQRVYALTLGYPYIDLFVQVYRKLRALRPLPAS